MTIPGLLALSLCVFWPVTIWYVQRLLDKSDEPLGVLSLIAFAAVILTRQGKSNSKSDFNAPFFAIGCLLVYAFTWPFAPKLLSAVIAVVTIGCLIDSFGGRFRLGLGSWLLLLFSLPIVSSLNFYSGFPLRVVVGKIAAPLISMVGFPTIVDGCALIWNNQVIQIDAPCSGIKMLWFALFIGAVLTAVLELSLSSSILVLGSAVFAALFGNVLRVTSLFFIAAKVINIDPSQEHFIHQAVGVVAFAIAAGITVLIAKLVADKKSAPDGEVHDRQENLPDFAVPASGSEAASPAESQPPTRISLFRNKRFIALVVSALIAAITPVAFARSIDNSISTRDFPGWPEKYDGATLQPVPPSEADTAFYNDFPGKIQCFSLGAKRVIIRWVAKPTRQLHPSSDCFRGLGYDINYEPLITDKNGIRWSNFTARKEGRSFFAHESI